jgi:hypothetical protein
MEQRATFLPSRNGLQFTNSWPPGPAVSVRTPFGRLGVGNAARGLCGGMVLAALDYWQAGLSPPATRPGAGDPLFRFIVRRLVDSWHIPSGVLRYYRWMRQPEVFRRTAAGTWPQVKHSIDAGQPAALGLVTVASANPLLIGHNHQVLAYAYRAAGTVVRLQVYDPNSGPDDAVFIEFDSVRSQDSGFTHNVNIGWPVRGFFLTRYSAVPPPREA